jgi:hypothetical protein
VASVSSWYDQEVWLRELGAKRPLHCAAVTDEILEIAGPPPIPPRGGGANGYLAFYTAVETLSLNADTRHGRAVLRAKQLRESGGAQSDLNDAWAEATFWAEIRDWAQTLK